MCDDVTRVEKYLVTQSNGKNGLEKNICHCNLIQFSPKHTMVKSYDVFIFYIFTTDQTYIWAPLDHVIKNEKILV